MAPDELLPRWEEIELAGPVECARSNKHTGMRHLPVRFGLARRGREA